MTGTHGIDFVDTRGEPLDAAWALGMVLGAYDYVLWSPDVRLLVRSQSLTTLRDARYRILSEHIPLRLASIRVQQRDDDLASGRAR